MTLVKSALKKVLPQKTDFAGKFSIGKIVFWLKLFDAPFDLFKEFIS
jgi:hypothetical protein